MEVAVSAIFVASQYNTDTHTQNKNFKVKQRTTKFDTFLPFFYVLFHYITLLQRLFDIIIKIIII